MIKGGHCASAPRYRCPRRTTNAVGRTPIGTADLCRQAVAGRLSSLFWRTTPQNQTESASDTDAAAYSPRPELRTIEDEGHVLDNGETRSQSALQLKPAHMPVSCDEPALPWRRNPI
jgi:hypothetical protein